MKKKKLQNRSTFLQNFSFGKLYGFSDNNNNNYYNYNNNSTTNTNPPTTTNKIINNNSDYMAIIMLSIRRCA